MKVSFDAEDEQLMRSCGREKKTLGLGASIPCGATMEERITRAAFVTAPLHPANGYGLV